VGSESAWRNGKACSPFLTDRAGAAHEPHWGLATEMSILTKGTQLLAREVSILTKENQHIGGRGEYFDKRK
jgi:hypothetical protein